MPASGSGELPTTPLRDREPARPNARPRARAAPATPGPAATPGRHDTAHRPGRHRTRRPRPRRIPQPGQLRPRPGQRRLDRTTHEPRTRTLRHLAGSSPTHPRPAPPDQRTRAQAASIINYPFSLEERRASIVLTRRGPRRLCTYYPQRSRHVGSLGGETSLPRYELVVSGGVGAPTCRGGPSG